MDYFNAMREKRPFGHSQSKHDEIGRKPSLPTVQVNKKGGVVNVTMHPIKGIIAECQLKILLNFNCIYRTCRD